MNASGSSPGDPDARARAAAYQLLARRARSTREVEERLTRKRFDPPRIARTIAHLQAAGYLDDARYARDWVAARSVRYGPRRLAQELKHKGVAEEVIREAVRDIAEDAEAHALDLARKKWAQLIHSQRPLPARRQALYAYLARRGYDADICSRVVRGVCGEERECR
jgi:regulatory protein